MRLKYGKIFIFFLFILIFCGLKAERSGEKLKKWLEEVSPIITKSEAEVFKKLKTPLEKENFIKNFWQKRGNEFKRRYYKRLNYVIDHFSCTLPGYLTDRGKVYLLLGNPHLIFSYPMGITENSPFNHIKIPPNIPVEIWQYRFIPEYGVGVNFLFISKGNDCNYTLINNPSELDAILGTYNQENIRENGYLWDFKDEFASYIEVRKVLLSSKKVNFKGIKKFNPEDFSLYYFTFLTDYGKEITHLYLKKNKVFSGSFFGEIVNIKDEIVKDFKINFKNNLFYSLTTLKRGIYMLNIYGINEKNETFSWSGRIKVEPSGSISKILFLKGVSLKGEKGILLDRLYIQPEMGIYVKKILFYYQTYSTTGYPIYRLYNSVGKLIFSSPDRSLKTLLKKTKFYTSYLVNLDVKGLKRGFYKLKVSFKGEKNTISSSKIFFKY